MALLGPNDNGFSHDSTSGQHIVMTSRWLVFCWFPSLDVMMNPSRYFFLDSSITQKVLEQFVFCWRSSDSSYVITHGWRALPAEQVGMFRRLRA